VSIEHHSEHNERHEDASRELEEARREQLDELHHNAETKPDSAKERAEAAREQINKPEPAPEPEPTPEAYSPTSRIPFLDHKQSYAATMRTTQRHLSPARRSFSKLIHSPAVEKTSEALEKTVARPSVTLGATWTALIVGSVFYLTAYHYGYMLSGSELLFSFIVGALIGILIEGASRAIRRR
jgi:hypothetical protein